VAQGWKLVSRFRTTETAQLDKLMAAFEDWKDYFNPGR
jgi:hypothetical protein